MAGASILTCLLAYNIFMRNAYKKGLSDNLSQYVPIVLKNMKVLKLNHTYDVSFVYGPEYKVTVDRAYKDSLGVNYQGDTLSLDLNKAADVTIYLPTLPQIKVVTETKKRNRWNKAITINGRNFKNQTLDISFQEDGILNLSGVDFDAINISTPKKLFLEMGDINTKNLKIVGGKKSELTLNQCTILNNDIVLGDSSKIRTSQLVSGVVNKSLVKNN